MRDYLPAEIVDPVDPSKGLEELIFLVQAH